MFPHFVGSCEAGIMHSILIKGNVLIFSGYGGIPLYLYSKAEAFKSQPKEKPECLYTLICVVLIYFQTSTTMDTIQCYFGHFIYMHFYHMYTCRFTIVHNFTTFYVYQRASLNGVSWTE